MERAVAATALVTPERTGPLPATANPARVLGPAPARGSLEPGARADLVVLEGDGFRHVPYRPGHDPVIRVVVGGEVGWER